MYAYVMQGTLIIIGSLLGGSWLPNLILNTLGFNTSTPNRYPMLPEETPEWVEAQGSLQETENHYEGESNENGLRHGQYV